MAAKRKTRPAKKKAAARSRKTAKAAPAARSRAGGKGSGTGDRVAQIQRLIDLMVAAGAVEVELEEAGTRLRVRLKEDNPPLAYAPAPAMVPQAAPPVAAGAPPESSPAPAEAEMPAGTEVFRSPMLGTFYRAPSPEAEPFVEIGDRVDPDATLCIIEAMKVMNEIKAEREMEIVDILVQNGDPVEYGQPLFVVKV